MLRHAQQLQRCRSASTTTPPPPPLRCARCSSSSSRRRRQGVAVAVAPGPSSSQPPPPPPGPGGAAAEAAAAPPPPPAAPPAAGGSKGRLAELQARLKTLGVAGVCAYGIFNSLYYCAAFLLAWSAVGGVPPGSGWAAAARRAAEVMALVWAGSQVTKLPRAGAALACAPLVERGLERLARALHLKGKRQAFAVVVAACLCGACALFGTVVAVAAL